MKLKSKKWTTCRFLAVVTILLAMLSQNIAYAESAENQRATTNLVKLDQKLGVKPGAVLAELSAHEHDDYYLGTPYNGWPLTPENCLRPNGAYGGNGGMNCTGFVASVLRKCGADLSGIASYGYSGNEANAYNWYKWMLANSVESYHYQTVEELLSSGKAQKGDVIFFDPISWEEEGADCHIGFFWGDSATDNKFWHSSIKPNRTNIITELMPKSPSTVYLFKIMHTGEIEVQKSSAHPGLTEENKNYSLEGAEYSVYKKDSKELVTVIRTDKNGYGKATEIPEGVYEIKETKAPKGYMLSTDMSSITVESGKTVTYRCEDAAQRYLTDLMIEKVDAESGLPNPQGKATLQGAEFEIKYYDVVSEQDPEEVGETPLRTWIFCTDESGIVKMDEMYRVEGDELFRDGENVVLPIGTITIREITAPKGYLRNSEIIVKQISEYADQTATVLQKVEKTSVKEQIIRGNLELVKIMGDTQARLAEVPFQIKSATTGESHVIITDQNGEATTENGAVWFGEGEPDSAKGALPYDTYWIEELECEVNEGYALIPAFQVTVSESNKMIHLGTLTNNKIPEEPEEPEVPEEPEIPKEPEKPEENIPVSKTVKTGDSANLIVLILSFILSCFTVLKCVKMARRK